MVEKINLSNKIWQIADEDLRIKLKASEYGEVILPFFVLKRLTSKVLTILKDMRRVLVCTHKKRSFLQTRRHTPYIPHTVKITTININLC